MHKIQLFCLFFCLFFSSIVTAQIPVEVLFGHKKSTLDVLFFRNIKTKEGKPSPFLFFNRNRVSIDYRQTHTSYLPQFGNTNAMSFNLPKLKGIAPVAVLQISGTGVFPKAGLQYFHRQHDFMVFTWLVGELLSQPNIDWFLLTRYEPKISKKIHLFSQLELFNALPTVETKPYSLFQRMRLGIKINSFSFGGAADFGAIGRNTKVKTRNFGSFVRYDF
jgi:hypothetical protein